MVMVMTHADSLSAQSGVDKLAILTSKSGHEMQKSASLHALVPPATSDPAGSHYQSACLRKNAGISKSSMPPLLKASTLAAAEVRLRQTLGVAMEP